MHQSTSRAANPRLSAILGVVLVSPLTNVAAVDSAREMGEVTIVNSEGVQFAFLDVPRDGTLEGIQMETESSLAAVVIVGPTGYFRFKAGGDWLGTGPGEYELPAGRYSAYFLSGESPMKTTFTVEGLSGEVELSADFALKGRFGPLSPRGVSSLAPTQLPTGVQVFTGLQPFEAVAITGFMIVKRMVAVQAEFSEYRWSGEEGVYACRSLDEFGISAGPSAEYDGVVVLGDYGPKVRLDYFRYGATLTTDFHAYGLWIERALSDPAPHTGNAEPPLLWGIEALDYDVDCLRVLLRFSP